MHGVSEFTRALPTRHYQRAHGRNRAAQRVQDSVFDGVLLVDGIGRRELEAVRTACRDCSANRRVSRGQKSPL